MQAVLPSFVSASVSDGQCSVVGVLYRVQTLHSYLKAWMLMCGTQMLCWTCTLGIQIFLPLTVLGIGVGKTPAQFCPAPTTKRLHESLGATPRAPCVCIVRRYVRA